MVCTLFDVSGTVRQPADEVCSTVEGLSYEKMTVHRSAQTPADQAGVDSALWSLSGAAGGPVDVGGGEPGLRTGGVR